MELPPPRTTRYLSLDHWRGFACLVVLVNHSVWTGPDSATWSAAERTFASLASRLWLGVPMFCVISPHSHHELAHVLPSRPGPGHGSG